MSEESVVKEENNKGEYKEMNVMLLSIELTRLNPMLDSKQYEKDGYLYRDILVEVGSRDESVIRINETAEGEYELLDKFNKLGEDISNKLIEIIENYCLTPVGVRLSR